MALKKNNSELKKLIPLNAKKVAACISDGGSLSKISKNFEERPVQIELLKNITKTFNKNAVGTFEAGTGVGKSYAYLIPAMLWAAQNKERVVISTGTINLQEQLSKKDIPDAKRILGEDAKNIKAVLVKGRGNYICLRRLENAKNERDLFFGDAEILEKICKWAKTAISGCRSELAFSPPETLWSRICSESDACMGQKCTLREKCFVQAVRREAACAQILVANHHLLFADIESRMHTTDLKEPNFDATSVLPPYRRIVFDEAHGIESAATSFFSLQITRSKILRQINLLHRERRSNFAGYIFTLLALSSCTDSSDEIPSHIEKIKDCLEKLEEAALSILQTDLACRLYEKTASVFSQVIFHLNALSCAIERLVFTVREIMRGISDEDKTESAYWETKAILKNLSDEAAFCRDFSQWDKKREFIFWIQKQKLAKNFTKGKNAFFASFSRTPLDIAPLMNEGVFKPMESVVCTSATLKIGNDFNFWMKRAGLFFVEKERLFATSFPSPFPYKKNVLFAVPRNIPFPDSAEFQKSIEKTLIKLIKAANGGTLVLFTSYESLRSAFSATFLELNKCKINLLCQGEEDRFRLLDKFKRDEKSVLFATDSFWQGIDVPGNSLRQVIIAKLPFSVPTDPVFSARAEAIDKRGGSSFMELSVPEAVIKFRQGFGRLVRRSDDKGAVVVLDRRIMEKRYGQFFLQSIPQCRTEYANVQEICKKIASIFAK